ncbi:MAG: hypothetical protein JW861_10450 [Bacteroidales bacterium]|nr:hypothetical protein [Bacteroidales bacterium]
MRVFLSLFLLLALKWSSFSQGGEEYMMVMVKNLKALKMSHTEQDFISLAGTFENLCDAQGDQWHPLYYAALCYINASFVTKDPDHRDPSLDKAQVILDKAMMLYPDESELFVLQGLLYQGRIQVDPAERGYAYLTRASQALETAITYNPENPRAYYLMGINTLASAAAAGEGKEEACKLFRKAQNLFDAAIPGHVLSPTWGGEDNDQRYQSNCLSR